MTHIAAMSPRLQARCAGAFQLLEGVTSAFGQVFLLGGLVVTGNAAATAANILTHERLFIVGFASCLVAVTCHLVWALLFYELFKPVSRSVSLAGLVVILVACAFQGLAGLLYVAPLPTLAGAGVLGAYTPEQLRALALAFLKLNGYAYRVYLVLFGAWCVVSGYLIYRSGFMPRVLGVLLAVAGLGWMTFLSPPLGRQLFPFVAAASAVGEIPLMLWLLLVGVNDRRWNERAALRGIALPRATEAL